MTIPGPTPGNLIETVDELVTAVNASGGSVAPADLLRVTYNSGHDNTVPTGIYTPLAWATNGAIDAIFDMTDATTPVVKQGGIYAVTMAVQTAKVAGKSLFAEIDLALNGEDASVGVDRSIDIDTGPSGLVSLTIPGTFYIPAGGTVQIAVMHNTGNDATVSLYGFVQQLAADPT